MNIFIPEHFKQHTPKKYQAKEAATRLVKGYAVPGYIITLSERVAAKHFKGKRKPSRIYTTKPVETLSDDKITDAFFCIAYYFDTKDAYSVDSTMNTASALADKRNEIVHTGIMTTLKEFASLVGKQALSLFVGNSEIHYPSNDPNVLQVVLGSRPPGESSDMWGTHVGDVMLDPQCADVLIPGTADGYGIVVRDAHQRRVGQIVGSTMYLCVPVSKDYVHVLAGKGTDVFRIALALSWNAYMQHRQKPAPHIIKDLKDYKKRRGCLNDRITEKFTRRNIEIDLEIAQVTKRLNKLLLEKRDCAMLVASNRYLVDGETIELEWREIKKHPLIERLEWTSDNCVHVHTNDIHATDNTGVERHLGRFIIRLVDCHNVYVWSKLLTHPRRKQHPHIGSTGVVCFGNVTTEISTLLADNKWAEVISLILQWLVEGYDENLADCKLEEWPAVKAINKHLFADLSSLFVSHPKSDSI